jgi:cystathionine beta-lyase
MRARDWKHKSGYTYGLHGTPTTFTAGRAHRCAGRRQAVRAGAQRPGGDCQRGNLALLKTGDEVLIPDNAYGPNKALAEGELAAVGHHPPAVRRHEPADLAARITDRAPSWSGWRRPAR